MNTSYQHHSPQSLESPHSQSHSLVSPLPSFINVNFDVDNPNSFLALAAISTNYDGSILFALATLGPCWDFTVGEAHVIRTTRTSHCQHILLDIDSLSVILSLRKPHLTSDWRIPTIISDVLGLLSSFDKLIATKIDKSANCRDHNML